MLTQKDLTEIAKIVDHRLDVRLQPLEKDMQGVKQDIQDMKQDIHTLKKDTKRIDNRTKKINKTLDVAIDMFDQGDIRLGKRVKRIENELGFSNIS